MQRVETRLDDDVVAEIQASGKSLYEFLREAVEEKLKRERESSFGLSQEERYANLEKRMLSSVEQTMLEALGAMRKTIAEQNQKDEQTKTAIKDALQKIAGHMMKLGGNQ